MVGIRQAPSSAMTYGQIGSDASSQSIIRFVNDPAFYTDYIIIPATTMHIILLSFTFGIHLF